MKLRSCRCRCWSSNLRPSRSRADVRADDWLADVVAAGAGAAVAVVLAGATEIRAGDGPADTVTTNPGAAVAVGGAGEAELGARRRTRDTDAVLAVAGATLALDWCRLRSRAGKRTFSCPCRWSRSSAGSTAYTTHRPSWCHTACLEAGRLPSCTDLAGASVSDAGCCEDGRRQCAADQARRDPARDSRRTMPSNVLGSTAPFLLTARSVRRRPTRSHWRAIHYSTSPGVCGSSIRRRFRSAPDSMRIVDRSSPGHQTG